MGEVRWISRYTSQVHGDSLLTEATNCRLHRSYGKDALAGVHHLHCIEDHGLAVLEKGGQCCSALSAASRLIVGLYPERRRGRSCVVFPDFLHSTASGETGDGHHVVV